MMVEAMSPRASYDRPRAAAGPGVGINSTEFAADMVHEAEAIVRSENDHYRLAVLKALVDPSLPTPIATTPYIAWVPDTARVEWKGHTATVSLGAQRSNTFPPPPPRYVLVCRFGEPSKCDLDRSNAGDDVPILLSAATSNEPQTLEFIDALLAAGANPDVAEPPGGYTVLDTLLRRFPYPTDAHREGMKWNLQLIERIARSGRATIRAEDRAELETDEVNWAIAREDQRAYFREVRDLTRGLPIRPKFVVACPSYSYRGGGILRLKAIKDSTYGANPTN
jgi:hypothetical protein